MKKTTFIFSLIVSCSSIAQSTISKVSSPKLVKIIQIKDLNNENIIKSKDEGTNDPTIFGYKKIVSGNLTYFVKENEKISIIYTEKK